jgi:hypothetical protein
VFKNSCIHTKSRAITLIKLKKFTGNIPGAKLHSDVDHYASTNDLKKKY